MVDVSKYLGREFHWKRYNCWDFVRDVWLDTTGVDIGSRRPEEWTQAAMKRAFVEQENEVLGKLVQRIEHPADPCLVMLLRPSILNHCGVLVSNRLLHMHPTRGVCHEDIHAATIGFNELRFYK